MKTSHSSGLVDWQSAACRAGRRRRAGPCGCGPGRGPCGRRSGPAAAWTALRTISRPSAGFASNQSPSWSLHDPLDEALGLGVAELGLGLALELRLAELDRDDRGQALADVVAGEVRRPSP